MNPILMWCAGTAFGVTVTALFAFHAVATARANADTWRRESAMWRARALGLGKEALK